MDVNIHKYSLTKYCFLIDSRFKILDSGSVCTFQKIIDGQNKKPEKPVRQCKMLISISTDDSMLHTSGEISYS